MSRAIEIAPPQPAALKMTKAIKPFMAPGIPFDIRSAVCSADKFERNESARSFSPSVEIAFLVHLQNPGGGECRVSHPVIKDSKAGPVFADCLHELCLTPERRFCESRILAFGPKIRELVPTAIRIFAFIEIG